MSTLKLLGRARDKEEARRFTRRFDDLNIDTAAIKYPTEWEIFGKKRGTPR